jgi:hypothetical protein
MHNKGIRIKIIKDDIMRGMYSRGHTLGLYFYHGKNGKIIVNEENKNEIKKDAEELSLEIFNSDWICPQAMFENELDDELKKNSSNDIKLKNLLRSLDINNPFTKKEL